MVVDLKSVPTLSALSLSSPSVFHQARRDSGDNRDKGDKGDKVGTDFRSTTIKKSDAIFEH